MRWLAQTGSAAAVFIILAAGAGTVMAAELEWTGGTDEFWHTPTNWSPIAVGDPPQMVQRVPQAGDTVLLSDTTHGSLVRLDGDTGPLAGLTISGGLELDTNGHFLEIGGTGTGATIIDGGGSRLTLPSRGRDLTSFQTDMLEVRNGGVLQLANSEPYRGVAARVTQNATIDSTSHLTGTGTAEFGTEETPAGSVALVNDGTISPMPYQGANGGMSLRAAGEALLDLDGTPQSPPRANEPGRLHVNSSSAVGLSVNGLLADPFGGTLLLGANDRFEAFETPFAFEDAVIEVGGEPAPGRSSGIEGIDITINGESNVTFQPGAAKIDGSFRVNSGTVTVRGDLAFFCSDPYSMRGGCHQEFGPESRLLLDDGSRLHVAHFVSPHIYSRELDLDGENGDVTIDIDTWTSLYIAAPAIDNDPDSPGFDGTLTMGGGGLTVDVPGGWELNGRFLMGSTRDNTVNGSPITINADDPDDGIIFAGGEFITNINADLIFTENGQLVANGFGDDYLNGNVTNFRTHLGSGEGALAFRGDVTTFAVPTQLHVPYVHFLRGTVVLEGDLIVPEGVYVSFDEDVQIVGPGRVLYEERGQFLRGDYNGNGLVEQKDLDLVLVHWGEASTVLPDAWVNDLPNGTIDQEELDRILAAWGNTGPRAGPVPGAIPEPQAWILLAMLFPGLLAIRRRRKHIRHDHGARSRGIHSSD